MRATTGRVAVVTLLMISVSGCTSGPSWGSLAWWRKKPDATAVASSDAPKYNPAAPTLPSATQNPSNSLTNVARPSSTMAASVPAGTNPAWPAGMSGYGATPAAYQNSAYPTTSYQPAKLGSAPGVSAANPTTNPWNSGVQSPGPAVGYGSASAMPGRYAPGAASATPPSYGASASGAMPQMPQMPQSYASGNPATAMASAPAYASGASMAAAPGYGGSAVSPVSSAQPQAGFYNPTYDGGGSAARYASGAAIPGAAPSASMDASASAMSPSSAVPNYRTADARSNSMSSGVAPMSNADAAAASANGAMVGDRYAGSSGATVSNAAPTADRYAAPAAAPAGAASGLPGAPDRYAQPAGDNRPAATGYDPASTGYQPGAAASPMGNSGYNPTDGSSTSAATGNAAMSGLPARSNTEYRPGGTSSYVSPSGNPVQPGTSSGAQPDTHSQNGVTPASYQSAETSTGRSMPGASLASATSVVPSNSEVYGAYQGGASPGASSGYSASEPAYGAPNPAAATPALLPAHSGW